MPRTKIGPRKRANADLGLAEPLNGRCTDMSNPTCSEPDCESRVLARGWCSKHYNQQRSAGNVKRNMKNASSVCAVDGCSKTGRLRRGMCAAHYSRWKRNGTTESLRVKTRYCKTCGDQLIDVSWKTKFCSQKCRNAARPRGRSPVEYWEIVEKSCIQCGRDFRGYKIQKYCTRPCYRSRHIFSKLAPGAAFEPIDYAKIHARDEWTCQICGQKVDPDLKWPDPMAKTVDHIVPISKGGDHIESNVQLAHFSCNLRKSDKLE